MLTIILAASATYFGDSTKMRSSIHAFLLLLARTHQLVLLHARICINVARWLSVLFLDAKVSSYEMFLRKPTLLWFVRDLGLTTQTGMSFLCIIGICVAVLGISSRAWRNFASFLTMWFLYFSLYQVSVLYTGYPS